jgi:hypothetical protein
MRRVLVIAVCVAGCGDDAVAPADGGHSDAPPFDANSRDSLGPDAGPECTPLTTILDGFIPLRTLHVSPSGNDANDGLSLATAWRSLANANQLLPGDRVEVHAGTYPCLVTITVRAAAAHPIHIRSADGPLSAVFDCTNQSFGFEIDNAAFIALDGFEIKLAQNDLIHVQSGNPPYTNLGDSILVVRNHLHHAGDACIKANQVTNLTVLDNEVDHPETFGPQVGGQAIDLVAVHGARILRNRVHDVQTNTAIQAKGGAQDTIIVGNRIWDVEDAIHMGGSTGPQYFLPENADFEADELVASNNLIWGATNVALSAIGCTDCIMANNSVAITAAQQPIRALPGSAGYMATVTVSHTRNLRTINNLLWFDTTRPMDLLNMNVDDAMGFLQSHNLIFFTGGAVAGIYSDVPPGGDGTILDRDPMLVAPATGDLHVRAGSPALGAGIPLPEVPDDPDGNCRSVWNIGAY